MSYCTQDDLVSRFGEPELIQLTDRDGDDEIDTETVALAIADADGEIDGYLSGRYQLPLATIPGSLTRIACDIARYRLWDDRATENVRKRYEDARRALEQIARGDISLGLPSAAAGAAVGSGSVEFHPGTHVWGRGRDGGL